jgi:hypothetical protein
MGDIAWDSVVGGAGLVLTIVCLWLTIRYGELSNTRLRKICSRLGLEPHDN